MGQTVCFSSFSVDIANQRLWGGEGPVALRPKTFAVLRHLVEHADCLVTRDDLIKAVWPDSRTAETGPKRCILELRTALGDRAKDPQFIETVGRLGYRFIAPLTITDSVRPAGHVREIAAEVAVHTRKGRDYQRAVRDRLRAAQDALQRSAHREAIDHLMEGLALLKHLTDN